VAITATGPAVRCREADGDLFVCLSRSQGWEVVRSIGVYVPSGLCLKPLPSDPTNHPRGAAVALG
jgi:hypothetical protein